MLYLLETNLPENKSVFFALTHVYGIGKNTAFRICKKLGFSINLKIKDLTQEQTVEIVQIIDSLDLTLNNELKKLKSLTLKNLILDKNPKKEYNSCSYLIGRRFTIRQRVMFLVVI